VRVRLVDLEHADARGDQDPCQGGGVGAGGLHADPVDLAEAVQPLQQLAVSGSGRLEGLGPQQRSTIIESGCVVGVGVRIDAADDAAVGLVHAVHCCPSLIGGTAGRAGGHNSDEALVASRFL
jgi:hypothetical protein